ncbi:replication protein [Clostridium sporogenes]|nr:replication protein [Clostridium sporogenes]
MIILQVSFQVEIIITSFKDIKTINAFRENRYLKK